MIYNDDTGQTFSEKVIEQLKIIKILAEELGREKTIRLLDRNRRHIHIMIIIEARTI